LHIFVQDLGDGPEFPLRGSADDTSLGDMADVPLGGTLTGERSGPTETSRSSKGNVNSCACGAVTLCTWKGVLQKRTWESLGTN